MDCALRCVDPDLSHVVSRRSLKYMPRRSIRRTIASRWLIGYRLAAVSLSQRDGKITAARRPTPLITGMSLNASAYRATSFFGAIAISIAVVLINALGAYNALA